MLNIFQNLIISVKQLWKMDVTGKFNFSPDATRLSVATYDGKLSIWNSASGLIIFINI